MFWRSPVFWLPFFVAFAACGLLFGWELGWFTGLIWTPPRPQPSTDELLFSALIVLLLCTDIGLISWRTRFGSCPRGTKRAAGIAGMLGAVTLLCPVCLVLPFSILSAGVALSAVSPFFPLLRIIALMLLGAALWMLWPRKD